MSASTTAAPDFSKPMVDAVKVPGAGRMADKTLSMYVSAELMKNQQAAAPVDATASTMVVQDSAGKPMIMAIGSDEKLRLLRYSAASETGWEAIDLGAGFTEHGAARAFDVAQDSKGRISIAFALARQGSEGTDVFTATLLSDDPAVTDWSKLAAIVRRVEAIDEAFAADTISVGVSDNGDAPLVVVSGAIGSQEYYYQIGAAGQPAARLEFPENVAADVQALKAISLGYAFGQKGVFFLYDQGQSQTLECATVAGAGQGALHYDYSSGQSAIPAGLRYTCMATPTGSQDDPFSISSDIFVGTGQGIFVIRNADTAHVEKVTDQLTDVHQILVRQDDNAISIWAFSSPSLVHYIRGRKGPAIEWDSPILFSTNAVHLAPIRNRAMQSNELFLIDQAGSVVHWWQDPTTTEWQERTIRTKAGDYLIDFCSYTTRIALEDEGGNPLAWEPLRVTASAWTYVTANGRIYSLDKDTPAVIPTDATGAITIVSMASNISTPILHVEGDSFSRTLNIYSNGKVRKGLQSITGGGDLTAARTQDGKPVFEGSFDQATWDGVADNVQQLNTAGSRLRAGTQPAGDAVFVAVEDASVRHDGVLDVSHLPAGFAVGMRRVNGTWQSHPEIRAAMSLGGFSSSITGLAGDLWHDIEHAFEDGIKEAEAGVVALEDGATFVLHKIEQGAEEVLAFTLKTVDKVITVALATLDSVLRVMSWILKQIGAALLKILEWLGFLIIWIDIWKAHKVIAVMMRSALDYATGFAEDGVKVAKAHLDQFFGTVEADLKALTLPPEYAQKSPSSDASASRASRPLASLRSPQANFVAHHLMHGGLAAGAAAAAPDDDNPLVQFLTDVVIPTSTAVSTDLQKDVQDLVSLLRGKGTYADVLKLAGDVAETAVDPVKTMLNGLLDFIADLLNDLKRALEGSLDVPFLGAIYKFVTELLGDEEELTPINAVALMVAIPTVIVGRIETGSVPLVDKGQGLGTTALFDELLGPPGRLPMPAAPAASGTRGAPGTSRVAMAAAPAASSPSAYDRSAAEYSRWAGLAGTIAGFLVATANIITAVGPAGTDDESTPIIEGKKAKLTVATAVTLGLALCKYGLTVPLYRKGQPLLAYVPKPIGFGLAIVNTCVSTVLAIAIPNKQTLATTNGAVLAAFDGAILIAALIADIADIVDSPQVLPALALTADTLSNGGGLAQGLGQAFGGTTPEAIESMGASTIAFILGAGSRFVGGGVNIIAVLEADADSVLQVVNVAG